MKGIIDVLKSVWQKLMGNEFTRWLVYIGIVAFCFCIMYNAGKMLGGAPENEGAPPVSGRSGYLANWKPIFSMAAMVLVIVRKRSILADSWGAVA